ncbi:MAG TPA: class I SAM-dependent methyltransferase [Vicingaceae bacterium]
MTEKTDFFYKEIDNEGLETLSVITEADNFNKWMFETIEPFCKGNILEIGSGIGNISTHFLENKYAILTTDIRDVYCNILKDSFKNNPYLLGVENVDIVHENFDEKYEYLLGKFDTVFALNVVEHIEDDSLAISNCKKLLKTGGHLIILVPAYQFLYNQFDKELFHYKRYVKNEVVELFKKNNFKIINSFYFNAFGIVGWFIFGRIVRKKSIPSTQMKFYNKIILVAKIIDKILLNRVGLSTIVIGKKD